MKKSLFNYVFKTILFCCSITWVNLSSTFSLKKVSTLFGAEPYTHVIERQFTLEDPKTLIIENIHGNIEVTTDWKKKSIFLSATKKVNNEENLSKIWVKTKHTKNTLTIMSGAQKEKKSTAKGSIDYQLMVPANMQLLLNTQHGTIMVKNVHGPITANTHNGNISIYNTNNTIKAETKQNGIITIQQASGPVTAVTNKGNITIQDAKNSITACTKKGRITANCADILSNTYVNLKTTSGTIALGLPKKINAFIHGNTQHGTITSQHYITLKPQTTKLDDHAWKQFKKETNGILGNGGATITLNSVHGNIKILDTAMG